jgi:hypothetical protein
MPDPADELRPRPFTQQLTGVVTAVDTAHTPKLATVDTGGGIAHAVACTTGFTPAVGDVLLLLVSDRRMYAVGKLSHPAIPTPLPPTPPPPAAGTTVFPAVAAGTYLDGALRADRTDVVQGPEPISGDLNTGVWTYAGIPAATLPGLTVTAAAVYLTRWPVAPSPPITAGLVLHDGADLPTTTPTILDTAPAPGIAAGQPVWVDIDPTWAEDILDPASAAAGIGVHTVNPADYAAFASPYNDAQSGALSITWTRE